MIHLEYNWCNFNKEIYILGEVIDKIYFPVLIPIGIIGNFLSFLVSQIPQSFFSDTFLEGTSPFCGVDTPV